jgi:magnesium-transporting ATPase (P-type)
MEFAGKGVQGDLINKILITVAIFNIIFSATIKTEGWVNPYYKESTFLLALTVFYAVKGVLKYNIWTIAQAASGKPQHTKVKVLRDSTEWKQICSTEIVVGDLIVIERGMRIPADCILTELLNSCEYVEVR